MRVVESKSGTTCRGGVTGKGFVPGQSGNPGGRPRGLSRRVRELVGENGDAIAAFMYEAMMDGTVRMTDRLEAGRWLADRGFGRAVQGLEIEVGQLPSLDLTVLSSADLEAMLRILEKYEPNVGELAATGEIPFVAGLARDSGSRRR